MLQVLRHYVPLRKALLIASETVLLALVIGLSMSEHLWNGPPTEEVRRLYVGADHHLSGALLRCLFSSFLAAVVAQVALAFNELYDFRRSISSVERLTGFVASAALALFAVLGLKVLTLLWNFDAVLDFPGLTAVQSIQGLLFAVLLGMTVLYFWRAAFHSLVHRFGLDERVLIVGTSQVTRTLVRELSDRAGYALAGVLPDPAPVRRAEDRSDPLGGRLRFAGHGGDARGAERRASDSDSMGNGTRAGQVNERRISGGGTALALTRDRDPAIEPTDLPMIEALPGESLEMLARRLRVDDVVVALEDRRGTMPTEDLLRCRLAGIVVEEGEALYERVTGKIAVGAMRPSYLIFNSGFARHPFSELAKRVFDVTCASLGLLFAWPLMLATAIAVKLDSPGPMLFRQERSGRFGEPIVVNKFRSMRADAEKSTGPVWATENDPRITRVGRFIRKTRLDELPQLLNVLGGSMSMVGPRPERPHFIADLSKQIPYYHQRHIVKPGVTGWAQINYPYGNTVEDALQKLQFDLFYIKYQSVALDLSICIQTVKTVLMRRGT